MTAASLLKNYFYRLYTNLLEVHVRSHTLLPTPQEEDCVKAFCILAHAAVEEYIETLSQERFQDAYNKYNEKKILTKIPQSYSELAKANDNLIQLIQTLVLATNFTTFSKKSNILKDYESKLEKVSEIYKNNNALSMQDLSELSKSTDYYTLEILKESSRFFKNHIDSNHGASLKYLLKILIPVGINIPNSDLNAINSLQKLAEYRGDYAHTKGLRQIISASDLKNYAVDVVKICFSIEKTMADFSIL